MVYNFSLSATKATIYVFFTSHLIIPDYLMKIMGQKPFRHGNPRVLSRTCSGDAELSRLDPTDRAGSRPISTGLKRRMEQGKGCWKLCLKLLETILELLEIVTLDPARMARWQDDQTFGHTGGYIFGWVNPPDHKVRRSRSPRGTCESCGASFGAQRKPSAMQRSAVC